MDKLVNLFSLSSSSGYTCISLEFLYEILAYFPLRRFLGVFIILSLGHVKQ